MRRLLIWSAFAVAASFSTPTTSFAQTAISQYPWCWEMEVGGSRQCYFATWDLCHQEAFYRGGYCIQSPYYKPSPAAAVPRAAAPPRHRRHAQ